MKSITGKIWNVKEPELKDIMTYSQKLGVGEIVARILLNRNVELADAQQYLEGTLSDMPDPYHFKDMEKATLRIVEAVKNNQKIAVFGDYDVDGSCGSAILVKYFESLGLDSRLYIPDRMTEGYGPNPKAFQTLKDEEIDLVITVDCGCVAFDAMNKAKELNLDVIITDHHQCEIEIPECIAMVNPNRIDEDGDFSYLAGATVAFFLTIAVNRALEQDGFFKEKRKPNSKFLLDLVAVATVCDLVPLKGLNRVFVDRGLKVLATRRNTGLKALSDITNIQERPRSYHCGFVLGPRINAAGRISDCDLGSKLLSTNSPDYANRIATQLHSLNAERKDLETNVQQEAIEQAGQKVKRNPNLTALVLTGRDWHPGVIGIVASRIKELYHLPVFIISVGDDICKGSGRSVSGVDLGLVVRKNKSILVAGGGHTMAAGLSIKEENIPAFEKSFIEEVNKVLEKNSEVLVPKISLDGFLQVRGANLDLISKLEQLEPFGMGNAEPKFAVTGTLAFAKVVGENHVRITLNDLGAKINGIAFSCMDSDLGPFLLNNVNEKITICGQIKRNAYNGYESAQVQILDAMKADFNS